MPLWEKAKRRRAVSGFRTASGRCASRSCDSCRVSSAEPTTVIELMVDLDYGHFSLIGAPIDHGSDDYSLAFDAAMEGRGIGQGGQMTVVRSQHQMNFEMPLRVEVWASEPPDDLDDWQEAFVAPIEISSSGLRYAAPTLAIHTVAVPAGRYTARITGRGFIARGWPGTTTPGDEWRIQLWSADEPVLPKRLREWSPPPPASRPESPTVEPEAPAPAQPDPGPSPEEVLAGRWARINRGRDDLRVGAAELDLLVLHGSQEFSFEERLRLGQIVSIVRMVDDHVGALQVEDADPQLAVVAKLRALTSIVSHPMGEPGEYDWLLHAATALGRAACSLVTGEEPVSTLGGHQVTRPTVTIPPRW